MSVLQEFKDFAMKGNVVDLAVGVIMGAAFGPIVSTLVDHVIMPPITAPPPTAIIVMPTGVSRGYTYLCVEPSRRP